MDSEQTAQCVVCSVVVCVLLIIVGLLIFIVSVFVLGPVIDEVQVRLVEINETTTSDMEPFHDYDYD
ncbi:uncharacterized protein LOC121467619 [Drosophila elegans]|uniref:uncharacterized protein LOC121467619 n=1 Tax=Drosophila elegans TaxID=30023 RepID=UPI001BC869DC|nr:uncharacterized protein LOC121467619 [Drosophila elegans]